MQFYLLSDFSLIKQIATQPGYTYIGRDSINNIELFNSGQQIWIYRYYQDTYQIMQIQIQPNQYFIDAGHGVLLIEDSNLNVYMIDYIGEQQSNQFKLKLAINDVSRYPILLYYSDQLSILFMHQFVITQGLGINDFYNINSDLDIQRLNQYSIIDFQITQVAILNPNLNLISILNNQNQNVVKTIQLDTDLSNQLINEYQIVNIGFSLLIAISFDKYHVIDIQNFSVIKQDTLSNCKKLFVSNQFQTIFYIDSSNQLYIFDQTLIQFKQILIQGYQNYQSIQHINSKIVTILLSQEIVSFILYDLEKQSLINISNYKQEQTDTVYQVLFTDFQVIQQTQNAMVIFSLQNYPIQEIQTYQIQSAASFNLEQIFYLNGYSDPFILINLSDYFSYLYKLSSSLPIIIDPSDLNMVKVFAKFIKPCINVSTQVDSYHLYFICPLNTQIYDIASMQFINNIKYLASENSYMKSIQYVDKNIFLIITNNKIDVFEINYTFKQKIFTLNQLNNPKVYGKIISYQQTEIDITIYGVTSQNIFQFSVKHNSTQFQQSQRSYKLVQVGVNSESDLYKNYIIQQSLVYGFEMVRYQQILTNDLNANQPFTVSDNLSQRTNFILEFQSSENQKYQLTIMSSNLFSSQFQNIKFSKLQLNFVVQDNNSLDINPNKQIKYFQISESLLQISGQGSKILIHDISTLVLNEIELTQEKINNSFQFQNIQSIIINNFVVKNINFVGNFNFLTFSNCPQLTLRNITIINSNFSNYIFDIQQANNQILIQDFTINNSYFGVGIIHFDSVANLIMQNINITQVYQLKLINNDQNNYLSYVFYLSNVLIANLIQINFNNTNNLGLVEYSGQQQSLNQLLIMDTFSTFNNIINFPILRIHQANNITMNNFLIQKVEANSNTNLLQISLAQSILINQLELIQLDYYYLQRLRNLNDATSSYAILILGVSNTVLTNIVMDKVNQIGLISVDSFQSTIQQMYLSNFLNINQSNFSNINNSIMSQPIFNFNIQKLILNQFNITKANNIFHLILANPSNQFQYLNSKIQQIQLINFSTTLYLQNSDQLQLQNVIFDQIRSHLGSPSLIISQVQKVTIQKSTFQYQTNYNLDNDKQSDSQYDGALNFQKCTYIEIQQSIFQDNQSFKNGGAIYFYNNQQIQIKNSQFISNKALTMSGGAIYLISSNIVIANSLFSDNQSIMEKGGAIYIQGSKIQFTDKTTVIKNQAQIGGGIYYDQATTEIQKDISVIILNNLGHFYGKNFGSQPRKIKQINHISKQQFDTITISNFQSGNYTKQEIYIQFFDEEDEPLNFSQKNNLSSLSSSIQQEINLYQITFDTQQLTDQIAISIGQQAQFDSTANMFKLNFTASFKNQTSFDLSLVSVLTFSKISISLKLNFRPCEIGEIKYFRSGYTQCDQCSEGTYSLADPNQFNHQIQCNICPDSAQYCQGRSIILKDNYWRESELTDNIYECQFNGCSYQQENINGCVRGYTGVLCQVCDIQGDFWLESYGSQGNQCLRCSKLYLVYIITSLSILFYILYIHYSLNSQAEQKILIIQLNYLRKLNMLYLSKSKLQGSDSAGLTKVFLHYIQIFSTTINFYENIPLVVKQPVDVGGNPTNVTYKSFDCLFKGSPIEIVWINRLLMQIAQLAFISLIIFLYNIYQNRKYKKKFYGVIYAVFLYLFYYPALTKLFISLCWCQKIGSNYYLTNDYSQKCFTRTHILTMILIILPLTVAWTIGIPYILFLKMRTAQKQNKNESIKYTLTYYILQQGYRKQYYYWELVRMFEKFLIMFLLNSFFSNLIQRLLITLICFTYLQLVIRIKPFQISSQMKIELILSQIIVVSLLFQSILDTQLLSQQLSYFIISILSLINIYGIVKVINQYLILTKTLIVYSDDDSTFKKILLKIQYFQRLFKKPNVTIFRVSYLWKKVQYKIVKKNQQTVTTNQQRKNSTEKQENLQQSNENHNRYLSTPQSDNKETNCDLIIFQNSESSIINL
ncbi:transmembrane protein, putative (macronuclear) [Tetrahymena thermophila SB210]|uniref:Transmembrane protein, putative n=1 Tax=Tetrahymena thermophila (strain SB210) TaxID=312017 RepID=Q22UV5_TETTS|nr:transmembrane protein, putative [Tetrahymena thermophila SB210]EAR89021.3 transmembrane protein, putative [Tetrahymena thermophila SB210]|eukprot:XP_001009266.3 transmembrane protein, putative [Tetrahymena thermophila SB210]